MHHNIFDLVEVTGRNYGRSIIFLMGKILFLLKFGFTDKKFQLIWENVLPLKVFPHNVIYTECFIVNPCFSS